MGVPVSDADPAADPGQAGFTLIEMMVALAIFSLAAMALLRLQGATLSSTALLQDQAVAQMVARNVAVETLTDPAAPAIGERKGQEANGGRTWTWIRRTGRSPEPRILQIHVTVLNEAGRESARLTFFRKAAG
jgi:general secretion pathway protein I